MKTTKRKLRRILAIGGVMAAIGAGAAGTAVGPASAQDQSRDYASDAFSNPWDYNDAADIIVGDGPMLNVANASVSGGKLNFSTTGPGYISPLWGGYPGAVYGQLDGVSRPIEASKYNRLAFKLTSSAPVNAGIRWYTCADGAVNDGCQGGFAFDIKPGTNVYDFELKPSGLDAALNGPWAGKVTGLRIAFAGSANMDLDWMSVYGGRAPGDGGPSGPSAKVINPDIEGGQSLGPLLRGKEWDMTDASDISRQFNVSGSAAGGVFTGTNAGPTINDPTIYLNLGCKTFKAADFHRFTVDFTYDGQFSVEDKPGGGMNQRLIWRIAGTALTPDGKDLQNSEDIVIYPGRRRFTVDLKTNPPAEITDPNQNGPRRGWVDSIENVRFDPNEDLGARVWRVHSMKLAADDMVAPGSAFKIEWSDANYRPGGTATVALSSSPDGSGATPIASNVPVYEGVNTTAWTADGSGSKWVVLTINRDGSESRSVSTGPVTIGAPQYSFGVNERGKDGTLAVGDRCPGSASAAVAGKPALAATTKSATTKTTKKAAPKKKK